jgi:uncharacterized SAM-binding protein YcdF (DUF218 family)
MSILILFILLILAIILIGSKHIRFCCVILVFTLIYSLSIASGLLPYLLLSPLQTPFAITTTPQWGKNNAIILLGGGTTRLPAASYIPSTMAYERINKTAELYVACHQQQRHCKIIISGGRIKHAEKSDALVYEKSLQKLNIPLDDFILELNSTDTQTNAEFTSKILRENTFNQTVIVTSSLHLKRALLWFDYFGVIAQPNAAGYMTPGHHMSSLGSNFASTDAALHEYLGLAEVYAYRLFNSISGMSNTYF